MKRDWVHIHLFPKGPLEKAKAAAANLLAPSDVSAAPGWRNLEDNLQKRQCLKQGLPVPGFLQTDRGLIRCSQGLFPPGFFGMI